MKETCHNIHNPSHEIVIPCVEAKSWVSLDWLMSSLELHPCLGLYQFAQALLKTKICKMERTLLYWKLARRSHCNLLPNGWRITRGTQPERKML
jgi:hypothetical protein